MSVPEKIRADLLLVQYRLVPSRARARAEIEAGRVWCRGERITKSSTALPIDSVLEIDRPSLQWVSRSAVKLKHALDHFQIGLAGKVVLDIGASAGGFTEVALAHGASKVYAVDVGHDQLHDSIKADVRVVSLEGVNARELSHSRIPEAVDAVVCDASFIGLEKILPRPLDLTSNEAVLVALIKPQFEAGPGKVDKRGVLTDEDLQEDICLRIKVWINTKPGWVAEGIVDSPILGSDGNREFLIAAQKRP
jgi:23S rRNA (cytidine1920-2'-O)/16S rRNA (cytidine1409-2'-O)-methyltransferase